MTTDYDFTEVEQSAIEKAAAEHLEFNFAPADAQDMAYDIARDIRDALVATALMHAADAILDHRDGLRTGDRYGDHRRADRLRGLEEAAGIVRSRIHGEGGAQ